MLYTSTSSAYWQICIGPPCLPPHTLPSFPLHVLAAFQVDHIQHCLDPCFDGKPGRCNAEAGGQAPLQPAGGKCIPGGEGVVQAHLLLQCSAALAPLWPSYTPAKLRLMSLLIGLKLATTVCLSSM